MNIRSIDGPGQGESNINAVWQEKDNCAVAAEKIIDWLITRDDVDPDRTGTLGPAWDHVGVYRSRPIVSM
jgi:hypothetical protein